MRICIHAHSYLLCSVWEYANIYFHTPHHNCEGACMWMYMCVCACRSVAGIRIHMRTRTHLHITCLFVAYIFSICGVVMQHHWHLAHQGSHSYTYTCSHTHTRTYKITCCIPICCLHFCTSHSYMLRTHLSVARTRQEPCGVVIPHHAHVLTYIHTHIHIRIRTRIRIRIRICIRIRVHIHIHTRIHIHIHT